MNYINIGHGQINIYILSIYSNNNNIINLKKLNLAIIIIHICFDLKNWSLKEDILIFYIHIYWKK